MLGDLETRKTVCKTQMQEHSDFGGQVIDSKKHDFIFKNNILFSY